MERPPSDAGFALLDALIAFAIFAVMTGMFVQVVHSSAITRRHAAETRAALLVAQSRLAAVAETDAPESSGREGRFHWRAQVSRYPGVENSRGLEQVTVSVTGSATGRTVTTLKSLRIAR
jgi:type II secretory pathway component PulJ